MIIYKCSYYLICLIFFKVAMHYWIGFLINYIFKLGMRRVHVPWIRKQCILFDIHALSPIKQYLSHLYRSIIKPDPHLPHNPIPQCLLLPIFKRFSFPIMNPTPCSHLPQQSSTISYILFYNFTVLNWNIIKRYVSN